MKTIHKYAVPVDDQIHVFDLPRPAEIVHVDSQHNDAGVIYFWAVVDPLVLERRTRRFKVVGTGHVWPADSWHIGSASVSNGVLVWHLLELDS